MSSKLLANALAQLLTVPPYVVGAIVLCSTAYVTDRLQSRGLAVAGACLAGTIGESRYSSIDSA